MSAIIGIDPGVKGGLAVLDWNGTPLRVTAFRPDMTHRELVDCVVDASILLRATGGNRCVIEKVGFIKGDGGKGANTFGRVDGLLRGAALALGLDVHDVYPMAWQAGMGCLTGGNKNISKDKALELFGDYGFKITHMVADALLIAEYGRRLAQREIVK